MATKFTPQCDPFKPETASVGCRLPVSVIERLDKVVEFDNAAAEDGEGRITRSSLICQMVEWCLKDMMV